MSISKKEYFWDFAKLDEARSELRDVPLEFDEIELIESNQSERSINYKRIIEIIFPIIVIAVIVFIL